MVIIQGVLHLTILQPLIGQFESDFRPWKWSLFREPYISLYLCQVQILAYNLRCPSVGRFKLAFVCTSPSSASCQWGVSSSHQISVECNVNWNQCNSMLTSWSMCHRCLGSLAATRCVHGQYCLDRTRREGWMKKNLLGISWTPLCHYSQMQSTSQVTKFSSRCIGTWVDELEAPHKVEVAGICSVSLHPQHYKYDAGDSPELWSLQDPAPKQPWSNGWCKVEGWEEFISSAEVCDGIATIWWIMRASATLNWVLSRRHSNLQKVL